MAQRKQVSWAQLRVGLLVVVSLTILGLMVFLMTGQGFFVGKNDLKLYVDNAGGLKKGDPVRLTGIDIGNVENIEVSKERDPQRAVVVTIRVDRSRLAEIRTDSLATLEVEGLLGQRFVDISRGDSSRPEIAAGGEIRFKAQPNFGDVMAGTTVAFKSINDMVASLTKITTQVESGKGTLGKFIFDDSVYKQVNGIASSAQKMVDYAAAGKGSLGQLIYSDDIYNHANQAVDRMNGMMDDVRDQKGSLGKFIYDPALYEDSRKMVADASSIVADAKAGKGTLGKMLADDTLYTKATSAIDRVDSLTGKLERGEGTLGKLFKDDALYNNTNGLSVEVRELLADFRKNPKKYMTIQLKIF